jgi:hypothetical protein
VVQIAAAGSHTLALLADGSMLGWGRGLSGAAPADSSTPCPLALPAGSQPVACIATGAAHSLALCRDGTVYSWGNNSQGQLGLSNLVDEAQPARLKASTQGTGPVRALAAGGHSSALLCGEPAAKRLEEAAARQPPTLSLAEVERLTRAAAWAELAELVTAVLTAPALLNASFVAEVSAAEGEGGGVQIRSVQLEAVYVALLKTFEVAPPVFAALGSSLPRLFDAIEATMGRLGAADEPPALSRPPSFASPVKGLSRDDYVLAPLAAALHNPLLSHASEAAHLLRAARLVDEKLTQDGPSAATLT